MESKHTPQKYTVGRREIEQAEKWFVNVNGSSRNCHWVARKLNELQATHDALLAACEFALKYAKGHTPEAEAVRAKTKAAIALTKSGD